MSRRAVLLLNGRFSRLFPTPSPPNRISLAPSSSSPSTIGRFFSSKADFSSEYPTLREVNPTATLSPKDDALIRSPDDASSDANDESTTELKKMIGVYMAGDMEVLPSIFEAIMLRKLSGEHEDSDNELMEEIRSKMTCTPESVEEEEEDLESDDDFDTSDEDSD